MKSIDLAGAWRLHRISTKESFPAVVPGDTHSALLAAGKIPDPYWGVNELEVQWVGREDWAYERSFDVDASTLQEDRIHLSFESLDTIAEVFLNGKSVGSADNMFVRWRFDAKRHLKLGKNTLTVVLASSENSAAAAAKKLPYPFPHTQHPVQSPHRNLIRKVQCHGGWDWGPCLMVAGIPGGASLDAWSDVRIDYVYTEQKHSKGRCVVRVFAECEAAHAGDYDLKVSVGETTTSKKVRLASGQPEREHRNACHLEEDRSAHPGPCEQGGQVRAFDDFPRERAGCLLQGSQLDPARRPAPEGIP
ncbi:MAG: sugar-binding domain-containing protein [Spirochaetia bacterium]